MVHGILFDARRLQLQAALGGSIRLRQYQRDFMTGSVQLFQRDAGKLGRTRKNELHSRSSRCALSIFLLIRLRLSGDRYSTNTLPSRWSISCWMHTASRLSASMMRDLPAASSASTLTASKRSTPS